jgi:hypothetical protein
MEHLGYVCNMLTAIGEAPHLTRPNFPLSGRSYDLGVPCTLEPFGLPALRRFILFEIPQAQSAEQLAQLEKELPDITVSDHQTIGGLYAEIKSLFAEPGATEVFTGAPTAQTTGTVIGMRGLNAGEPGPIYDVLIEPVTGPETADAAITQIIEEGEGGPHGESQTSHFARFRKIHSELEQALQEDPSFKPARPTVHDPDRHGAVTDRQSAALCELFDLAYATTVLLLARLFTHAGESLEDVAAAQHVAFFPMMTMVLRPLGELLTEMPAKTGVSRVTARTPRAGPRFVFTRTIAPLPHTRTALIVIGDQLTRLAQLASELAAAPGHPGRLELVAENLQRLANDFDTTMGVAR